MPSVTRNIGKRLHNLPEDITYFNPFCVYIHAKCINNCYTMAQKIWKMLDYNYNVNEMYKSHTTLKIKVNS